MRPTYLLLPSPAPHFKMLKAKLYSFYMYVCLKCFRAFPSVVRQMPGYITQRLGTARTLPNQWIVLFYVMFVCICVLYYCHRVATQLQLNISYHIISHHISYYIISYHISYHYIISYNITSHHIISYHIISYHISYIKYHIILYNITLYHIISYHITSHHIYYIISHHILIFMIIGSKRDDSMSECTDNRYLMNLICL
jgi:hypothetical protein